ncbi:MAG: tetratricopeptide repeat protein, partial [Anaerolineae bacterium]|nr:tetratricopeptide repeat protein [Anaerolineae bacterium]
MAKVALRAYTREIAELIDQGQIEESIAHCLHILEYFPKLIEAYRLLGKSYLESQRFGDASDIFQRVLSSQPDDFISHVGMSIVREDEGNLDAAIWHMERAFEVQPSNQAIQSELRRLFGRRDGMEPPKIRLTRGALARMYAHGELYDQSIAELTAALAEDPHRADLQILLARMYFQNNKHVDAAEICTTVLNKLPFCLDANHILSQILANSDREEEAAAYIQQVEALSPYLNRTSSANPLPANVPDQAVTVEKLLWDSSMGSVSSGQPGWASSAGVSMQGDSKNDSLPDWLTSASSAADEGSFDEVSPSPPQSPQRSASSSSELPDWLAASSDEEDEDSFTQSVPSDDYLGTSSSDFTGDTSDEDVPDWLASFSDGSPESGEGTAPASNEQLPDFLQDLETNAADDTFPAAGWDEPAPSTTEDVPDWLSNIQAESQDVLGSIASPTEFDSPPSGRDAIDWNDQFPAGNDTQSDSSSIIKDIIGEPPPAEPPEDDTPDWMQELTPDEPTAQPADDTPDWMQELASDGPTAQPANDTPDWMQELAPDAAAAQPAGDTPACT